MTYEECELFFEQERETAIQHCLDLMLKNEKLEKENAVLENAIEKAKKDHVIFTKSEVINFTSKCVWEALNPDTKMCVPNAMFIKIEELLKDYIEKELAK